MDETDRKLIAALCRNSRSTAAELGRLVGLSAPAAAERMRKMEAAGVIKGYTAKVSRMKTGLKLTAFIAVRLEKTDNIAPFREAVIRFPAVMECHHVAGGYDYLLKVAVGDTAALEDFLSRSLKKLPGVSASNTTVVLSTLKEEPNAV